MVVLIHSAVCMTVVADPGDGVLPVSGSFCLWILTQFMFKK